MIIKAQVPPSPPKTIKANPNGVKQKKEDRLSLLKSGLFFLLIRPKAEAFIVF
jgi:hypothetical protein